MILDTFHGHYNSFFDSEKKIADYIIQHPKEVVNMTIKELAQAYNTSKHIILRRRVFRVLPENVRWIVLII